ncbi:MAG: hypothetical protein VW982_08145 [Candidatus Poseidoniales archaeon]|jgi:hypothetical protein
MPEFTPALPKQATWSLGDNKYDDNGKNPKQLTVFIPLESVHSFANHLMNMADDPNKVKTGKVYNYDTKATEEVDGIYLNYKGKQGEYGAFGNINPAALNSGETPAF